MNELLAGISASRGKAEGRAIVVSKSKDLDLIEQGDILVSVSTSPAFSIYFGKVKAVVTDAGGIMAHAAIVSREYGIPCVVGTKDATKKIKTGDMISVDGDNGRVYRV